MLHVKKAWSDKRQPQQKGMIASAFAIHALKALTGQFPYSLNAKSW